MIMKENDIIVEKRNNIRTLHWFFSNITFLSLCFISPFQKRGWPSPARRWIANPLILRSREFKSPSSRNLLIRLLIKVTSRINN